MIRRAAEQLVTEALADTPVVLVHGPRQAGKSTLAREVAAIAGNIRHITLDDPIPLDLASRDPAGFIAANPGPILIDEIQRAPGLFLAMKAAVDRDRKPGRFLLTGSANVLALPKVADSLAGRMAVVDLLPFSQSEIEGVNNTAVDDLFDPDFEFSLPTSEPKLADRITLGGYPEPFGRSSSARRDAWFSDYLRTILERDVRDLANIEGLTQLPRLLSLIASRIGDPLNVVGLARETGIPNTSLHRYIDLLKAVFLLQMVPAWSNDPDARLTRTAKAYMVDTGLLSYLVNVTPKNLNRNEFLFGRLVENLVALELLKLSQASDLRPTLYHLRTVKHLQVDFVLEARGGALVGIDVHPSAGLVPSDADGLRYLREIAPDQFSRGIILYLGEEIVPFGDGIFGVPISMLWSGSVSQN